MNEVTVVTPLSGEEVIDSICEDIRRILRRDCYLNPALAYDAYECTIAIKLKLADNGREPEVESEIRSRSGQPHLLDKVSAAEAFRQLHRLPPNTVRENAGLAIPTLVEDSSGKKEIKNVKYRTEQPKPEHPAEEKKPQPQPQPGPEPKR